MTIFELISEGKWEQLFLKVGADLILSVIAIIIFSFIVGKEIKKRRIMVVLFVYLGLSLGATLVPLPAFKSLLDLVVISLSVLFILLHEGEWKKVFSNNKKSRIIIDDDEKHRSQSLYKSMKDLVTTLSTQKTGAIITFEKSDDLDQYIREGVPVNAPLSVPLALSIFYVGTPLHDGAMIVRDGMIVAASVFYMPTTRAMNGKFGARHRAALGISEASDSVTVIVSEETGRISFAYMGELMPTSRDGFIADFSELMER